jgi:hypothetical protein
MSRKKNRSFKSLQEYREFYSNSPAEKKLAKDKYYQMGTEAAKLASEQTFKKLDLG